MQYDSIAEIIVLELIALNAIENDSVVRPLFVSCWDPWIALCAELDLASLAVHLIGNEEVVME
jgi:hypothetical protein